MEQQPVKHLFWGVYDKNYWLKKAEPHQAQINAQLVRLSNKHVVLQQQYNKATPGSPQSRLLKQELDDNAQLIALLAAQQPFIKNLVEDMITQTFNEHETDLANQAEKVKHLLVANDETIDKLSEKIIALINEKHKL
jgi:hypothetical protein